jgi:hypothetical protein
VRPAKIFQQGQIVDAESAVDAAHHHHIDEAERQDDVAVEKLWTHRGITSVAIYLMEIQPGLEELKEINSFCTDASLISQYCIAVKDLPEIQRHADRYFPSSGARPLQLPLMCCVSPTHGKAGNVQKPLAVCSIVIRGDEA